MTVIFDSSLLTAYYQARAGLAAGGLGLGVGAGAGQGKANPTAPWAPGSTAPRLDDLVRSVLAGRKFIDPNAAKLDVPGASDDYKRLFGLYQGLNALQGVADQMGAKGITETRKAELRTRFNAGMAELGAYLDKTSFDAFQLSQGTVDTAQTAAGIKRPTSTYTTGVLHSGSPTAPVAAFQGAAAFSVTITRPIGPPTNVDFDLAEMGATPRTMANVVGYLNTKLAAAGAATRFTVIRTPGTAKTATAAATPDTYALQLKGSGSETATFSAAASAPAVYLGGSVGAGAGVRQVLKYQTDPAGGATDAADGKVFAKTLGPEVQAVRASQVAADGSLYVLADINGKIGDQAIKGTSDVALLKYDSAGTLLYSRTLGAAKEASGYALAVSADGSRVGVAGSVKGALDSGDAGADPALTDSFVAVFDALGQEVFSQRKGAAADDRVNAISFAADGSFYVSGVTSSSLPGAAAVGGQDAFVRGYKPAALPTAEAYANTFTVQYGTAGNDVGSSVAISGSTMIVAGVESGHAVVRRYDLQPSGAPTLSAVRDLGALGGGGVAGVAIDADGSVIVAGSTRNGGLSAGQVTTAYTSGQSAFVARLSSDLGAGADERLTYYNGTGDRSVSAVTLSNGVAYVAGQMAVTPFSGQGKAFDGYAAAIDPLTGAVSWSKTIRGADQQSAPTTIAVDASGASTLDRLGLPTGAIDYGASQQLVANSAVRAGDQFFIRAGSGSPKAVTIEATDTLKTLAAKISKAAGFAVNVTVTADKAGYDKLKIAPSAARNSIELEAGKPGRDALAALGLSAGLITTRPDENTKDSVKASYGLKLSGTISIDSDVALKQAQGQIVGAMSAIRGIYRDMTATPASRAIGPAPAYLTKQLASYQDALRRLGG